MAESDLTAAIKLAKAKPMRFVFLLKGTDGKLIVSKNKIPPKEIAEARKELGGGTPVTGKCTGPLNNLVFQVAKAAPSTLAATLKKVIKNETGLTTAPDVQLAADADAEEEDGVDAAAAAAPAAPAKPALAASAAPAAPPKASLNLGPWQAARQKVINDLKALAKKVAATKHGTAAGVLMEINGLIAKLPASPGANEIDKLVDFVTSDGTIMAAEAVPGHFHKLSIRKPLLNALVAARQHSE
jgi:hypothetical protein